MKARINLILCLLLIAITISLIAVSFGWYAAEAGRVSVEDSSVTITTSNADFYAGGANFEFVSTMSRTSEKNIFKAHTKKQPYYGEPGVFNEEYILLVRIDKNAADSDGNPISNSGYPYIKEIELSLGNNKINKSYVDTNEYKNDFQILYVSYNENTMVATKLDVRDASATHEYIAIIFGNGSSIFKYSINQYLGYKFTINMDYYNK